MFFFILIIYLVYIVLILQGEILSWSLMGVKGLTLQSQKGSCNPIENLSQNQTGHMTMHSISEEQYLHLRERSSGHQI